MVPANIALSCEISPLKVIFLQGDKLENLSNYLVY